MILPRLLIALPLPLVLAACSTTAAPPPKRPTQAAPIRPSLRTPPPVARVQAAPGLEGVVGANRDALIRQFGTPRLDVWEGDARKLQFVGGPCVLDIYLYPPAKDRDPEATFVDARRASDGQDVDRAACVAALRKR
ncbi:MAG: hypothetical protein ABL914_03380 [Novosphingobium sp.]|uniref:hypothetical protein n=1 Tax=Novosphingobium sp. TaxID=1874826 RepID=UPI0032BC5BBD